MVFTQEWGKGQPVIMLHPLALESTAFGGVGRLLARRDVRAIAADLPGFGRTPGPDAPLTPACMAEPVIELARSLATPPVVLGMSMGGRVALEAALCEPAAFHGIVLVAPFLPWRSQGAMLSLARWLSPKAAERIPLEWFWPLLQRISTTLEGRPEFEQDWLARASVRVGYYLSCPATRAHFVSAAREMALDPAFGPDGTWTRLERLAVPAAFVWGERDALIPARHAAAVAELLPRAHHVKVACSGHFMNGRHHLCFETAMASAVLHTLEASDPPTAAHPTRARFVAAPCLSGAAPSAEAATDEACPSEKTFTYRKDWDFGFAAADPSLRLRGLSADHAAHGSGAYSCRMTGSSRT
ncbi:MAG TPA: alpha/beta hydrolase [Myxococcota bacterium]|nr:alpha/beta hydrolase [Myxococcota bacterium]